VKRREFISLIGSTAAAWPLTVRAQQPMPVIGVLDGADGLSGQFMAVFRQGLTRIMREA
jgi:putative ABC transport system substrate-binding protein